MTPKSPEEMIETIPYWNLMIAHMDAGWKKKKGIGYPWRSIEMKDLAALARRCEAWGVMALWDLYLAGKSYWGPRVGFMLEGFWRDIGILLDQPDYKTLAAKYRKELEKDLPTIGQVAGHFGL